MAPKTTKNSKRLLLSSFFSLKAKIVEINVQNWARSKEQFMRICRYLLLICILIAVFTLNDSFAATDTTSQIRDKFQSISVDFISKLGTYALGLFQLMLLVDVGVFGVRAALNRSEMSEILSQFCMMLLFASFCYVAIINYQDWTDWFLSESHTIATAIGGVELELTPIDTGFKILQLVYDECSLWSPIESLGYFIFGAVILVCFALMTARIMVIICESYIAMAAALLLLGFGGSSMTKDYAINTMRYTVSVAFKLFVMRLLLAVGLTFITNLSNISKVTYQELAILLASAVILLVLVNTIPETVAGIINGSHTGSGHGIGHAAKGLAAGAAVAMGGAAVAVGGAVAGAKGMQTVTRAAKIASMEGHGGLSGTVKELGKSFQAARRQDGGAGGIGSTLTRMRTNTSNMYDAQKAMKDPDHKANPYMSNPYSGSGQSSNDVQGQGSQPANQQKTPQQAFLSPSQQGEMPGQEATPTNLAEMPKPSTTMKEALSRQKENSQPE